MAGLCREFGISRKTGYKILTRYNEIGLEGLTDRSRRPYRQAAAMRRLFNVWPLRPRCLCRWIAHTVAHVR